MNRRWRRATVLQVVRIDDLCIVRKFESDSDERCRLAGVVHVDSGVEVLRIMQLERVQQSALEFEQEHSGWGDAHCQSAAAVNLGLCT